MSRLLLPYFFALFHTRLPSQRLSHQQTLIPSIIYPYGDRNWLTWLWKPWVPWSDICKLENKGSRWFNSVLVRCFGTRGANDISSIINSKVQERDGRATAQLYKFWSKFEGLRTRSTNVRGHPSSAREQICPSSSFLFYSGPHQIEWCPPVLVRPICLTQSTDPNANLFQKYSHRHTQK